MQSLVRLVESSASPPRHGPYGWTCYGGHLCVWACSSQAFVVAAVCARGSRVRRSPAGTSVVVRAARVHMAWRVGYILPKRGQVAVSVTTAQSTPRCLDPAHVGVAGCEAMQLSQCLSECGWGVGGIRHVRTPGECAACPRVKGLHAYSGLYIPTGALQHHRAAQCRQTPALPAYY